MTILLFTGFAKQVIKE